MRDLLKSKRVIVGAVLLVIAVAGFAIVAFQGGEVGAAEAATQEQAYGELMGFLTWLGVTYVGGESARPSGKVGTFGGADDG